VQGFEKVAAYGFHAVSGTRHWSLMKSFSLPRGLRAFSAHLLNPLRERFDFDGKKYLTA